MPTCSRTRQAEEDLIDLWMYIASENPSAATLVLDRIETAMTLLSHYPAMGPARPDLAPELRYFVSGHHLILYRQITDGVEIVRVVHGARHLPDLI